MKKPIIAAAVPGIPTTFNAASPDVQTLALAVKALLGNKAMSAVPQGNGNTGKATKKKEYKGAARLPDGQKCKSGTCTTGGTSSARH